MGVKRHRAATLQPKGLPVHGEAQHLQRGLEGSIRSFTFLPDDAVAGGDILASCDTPASCGCAAATWLVDDL